MLMRFWLRRFFFFETTFDQKNGKKKCFQHLKRDWERDDIPFPPPNFSLSSGEPRCSYLTLLICRFVGLNVIYCPTISQTIRKFAPYVIRVTERGWNSRVLPSWVKTERWSLQEVGVNLCIWSLLVGCKVRSLQALISIPLAESTTQTTITAKPFTWI